MTEVNSKLLPSFLRSNHPEMGGGAIFQNFQPSVLLRILSNYHTCGSLKKGMVWFIGADSQSPSPSPRSGYSEALTIINSNPPTSQTHPYHPFASHIIVLGSHKPTHYRDTNPTHTNWHNNMKSKKKASESENVLLISAFSTEGRESERMN